VSALRPPRRPTRAGAAPAAAPAAIAAAPPAATVVGAAGVPLSAAHWVAAVPIALVRDLPVVMPLHTNCMYVLFHDGRPCAAGLDRLKRPTGAVHSFSRLDW